MKLNLKIWRQASSAHAGKFAEYLLAEVSPDSSFLEMLDLLNEHLSEKGEEPVAFDHDCREGICGCCSMVINGRAHGPRKQTTACQLHMRNFKDGDTITIEPWRARAFPVIKDLVVDRSALDRIIQAGGYISVNTGAAQDANIIAIEKDVSENSMDAASCIGCGACVAACPNGSASLFTAAKISHLSTLLQGQPEKDLRAIKMVEQMDKELFGSCTNHGECQEACPKGISIKYISKMNRDYISANVKQVFGGKAKMGAQ